MKIHKFIKFTALVLAWVLAGIHPAYALDRLAVIDSYADIALATYGDSLIEAQKLLVSVERLIESPTNSTLSKARDSWITARVPYQQSEVFRFGNSVVDEWEGKVNAWPLMA